MKLPLFLLLLSFLLQRTSYSWPISNGSTGNKENSLVRADIREAHTKWLNFIGSVNHSLFQQTNNKLKPCKIINGLKLCINGLESALNSQSKWLIATFFVGLLLWRRNRAASWAAIGSAINVGLFNTLKKMLNQERPVSHLKRSDPGMPSSHAQSIFYTSTFAIISMVQYQGFNGFTKLLLSPLIFAFGVYLSWLRVSHQFHTIDQVKVGAAIGTAFSILWFWSWDAYVLNVVITYSWVRNVVALGAVGYCLGFIVSISQNFLKDGLT